MPPSQVDLPDALWPPHLTTSKRPSFSRAKSTAVNGATPIELTQLHPRSISQADAALVELFNYAIGMTDYSGVFMHNIEPIRSMDGTLIPVSYDFDWSGTIDARYAEPNPSLPIRNVRQRIFQGFC